MRIIGGKLKGRIFKAPKELPVRPTTDLAKEALFNILNNQYNINELSILDLFSGTGSIGFEFASRSAKSITLIDKHPSCINWLKNIKKEFNFDNVEIIKADIFKFLKVPSNTKYDIIFADPPYEHRDLINIPNLIFENSILSNSGTLILEHPSYLNLEKNTNFINKKKYGNTTFSFFSNKT